MMGIPDPRAADIQNVAADALCAGVGLKCKARTESTCAKGNFPLRHCRG